MHRFEGEAVLAHVVCSPSTLMHEGHSCHGDATQLTTGSTAYLTNFHCIRLITEAGSFQMLDPAT